ncbi:PREDICTED: mucin-13 [Dipodomys ordii]|uniref:Mucin-13 n=1 Tax=Dipodomys ordii TaxID=10020 RepID=A0A1S3FFQ8_DIPOR|nr:PREDICTED: mucin-13 [Dipodomys ordii]
MRAAGLVQASVQNIFAEDTDQTESTVSDLILQAAENDTDISVNNSTSDLCQGDPCGIASCVELNNKHFCKCPEGYYYTSLNCTKGKTFLREITVTVNDTSGLDDEHSLNYQELHDKINTFFTDALKDTDYKQTVIAQVSILSGSARSLMRAAGLVRASVQNIFAEDTKQTESTVSVLILRAAENNPDISVNIRMDPCESSGCKYDGNNCTDILLCECKTGLQRPNPFSTCNGLHCPDNCIAENKKQCTRDSNGASVCECLPGYKNDKGFCEKCPFGYNGKDCEDQFQLILTIVGTIAAFLILALVIALIVSVRSKNKGKNIEEQHLIDNDFQNLRLQQTGFSNAGAEGNIFPQVRTSASRNTPEQNPYISQKSIPRPDY